MEQENDKFVAFILTHGRPNNVKTYETLKRCGYTGDVRLVCDDEDETLDEYKKRFKEKVCVFSKREIAMEFDEIIKGDRRSIVYARNACFKIAEDMGYRYFIELDDDYHDFELVFDRNLEFRRRRDRDLDKTFRYFLDFFKKIPAKSIAFAQGGDFIGGAESHFAECPKISRKCMNSFFCDVCRPFRFIGRINEDVNTYTTLASRGDLFLTLNLVQLTQTTTQASKGGMTDVYLDGGTYLKSFFSVITMPSSVIVKDMGDKHRRLHHQVNWKNTAPKILREIYKK